MNRSGTIGHARDPRFAMELMATYDKQEDIVTNGTAVDLTTGTMGDGTGVTSGVGDGSTRSKYYCRGFHNFGSSAVDVKYYLIGSDGTVDTSNEYTLRLAAGNVMHVYGNVGQLTTNTTNPSSLKLFYKERPVVDGSAPVS